jgi:DmsE family decaheme c-type cytochrome
MPREISFRVMPLILSSCAVLLALSSLARRGSVAEERVRTSEICLGCHAGQDSSLVGTSHWTGEAHEGPAAVTACTDCHAGDRRHWEEDPAAHPMTNPAKVNAAAVAAICSDCHQNAHQQDMLEKNVHTAAGVSCTACHRVHGTRHPSLLKADQTALCLQCHAKVEGQFARPFRHPVAEGVVECSDCHRNLDRPSRTASHDGGNVCFDCHGEFAGPFPFEHQATLDHSAEEGGCLSCHEPHGSALPRMVKQPYAPPHAPLCSQCHSVPRHQANTMHGTQWAGVPCNDCHVDIHGSHDNRLFVNESLQAQGCFNSGCHGLGR